MGCVVLDLEIPHQPVKFDGICRVNVAPRFGLGSNTHIVLARAKARENTSSFIFLYSRHVEITMAYANKRAYREFERFVFFLMRHAQHKRLMGYGQHCARNARNYRTGEIHPDLDLLCAASNLIN